MLSIEHTPVPSDLNIRMLGSGASGTVTAETKDDGTVVAVKRVRIDGSCIATRDTVIQEARILFHLNHPNVVKLFSCFMTSSVCLLEMEHGGVDLLTCVERLEDPRGVFLQVCAGVSYLHAQSIAHRDLKLENLTIDATGHVRIVDFGLSKWCTTTTLSATHAGSMAYAAPELWVKGNVNDVMKADVWSMGIVLFALGYRTIVPMDIAASKDPRFCAMRDAQVQGSLPYDSIVDTLPDMYTIEWLRKGINATLAVVPSRRAKASELSACV